MYSTKSKLERGIWKDCKSSGHIESSDKEWLAF